MYTVSKGPSKIVAKTRRGISQNLERLETLRDLTRKADLNDDHETTRHVPKPVFHLNGKSKLSSQRHQIQEIITPQHEELIKFVYESWNQVNTRQRCESFEGTDCSELSSPNSIVYYNDGEPNVTLQDFKPFDLESWEQQEYVIGPTKGEQKLLNMNPIDAFDVAVKFAKKIYYSLM